MPASPKFDLRTLPPDAAWPRSAWARELWRRTCHLFWLKLLGVTGFLCLFFIAYFQLLRHPARPVLEMPLTALDHAISLQPSMFAAYVSLWVYMGIAPGLLPSLRQLVVYALWGAAVCIAGLLCFYVLPTAVPRPEEVLDLAQHPGLALLAGVDAAGNACPSMHVTAALYTSIWIDRQLRAMAAPLRLRAVSVAWMLLIVYSTLAIKQHVVYDVIGGALLALLFAWPSQRWFPGAAAAPVPNAGLVGGLVGSPKSSGGAR